MAGAESPPVSIIRDRKRATSLHATTRFDVTQLHCAQSASKARLQWSDTPAVSGYASRPLECCPVPRVFFMAGVLRPVLWGGPTTAGQLLDFQQFVDFAFGRQEPSNETFVGKILPQHGAVGGFGE